MIKVYLAGPIANSTDHEAGEWRTKATEAFRLYGVETVDPFIQRDYRDRRGYDPAEVVEPDKADILECDVLLANCWKTSTGTCMEILFAWERKKRVIIIHPNPLDASPWLKYHSEKIVHDLYEVIVWYTTETWPT